jgi:cell wall-associated NlpC family hydrolase
MLKKFANLVACFIFLTTLSACAIGAPITLFPIEKYDQKIDRWILPTDSDYDKPLIEGSVQKKRLQQYYNHYYATDTKALSPWSSFYVNKLLPKVQLKEQKEINAYSNKGKTDPEKIGYGANFRPYSAKWINDIVANMDVKQFAKPIKFKLSNRGIAVRNLIGRVLPTDDVYFHSSILPVEGYPFDGLQNSSIWVGTPVYVVGKTLDQQWSLVITPAFRAWVESDGIANVSEKFVSEWQECAQKKMVAIVRTKVSVFDTNKQYRFNAYVGTVFPGKNCTKQDCTILIPVADEYHNACTREAKVKNKDAVVMPLRATPRNFTKVMSTLLGRPYGWSNMYFYNDCSGELRSLYTPFGIWLSRNSSQQVTAGRMVDKSALDIHGRLDYLMANGKKFTTIIFTGGHIVMYIGTYPNSDPSSKEKKMAMTYQNVWGVRLKDNNYIAVIGGSVLLPMLKQYPGATKFDSSANKKYFQVIYLDEFPDNDDNK